MNQSASRWNNDLGHVNTYYLFTKSVAGVLLENGGTTINRTQYHLDIAHVVACRGEMMTLIFFMLGQGLIAYDHDWLTGTRLDLLTKQLISYK